MRRKEATEKTRRTQADREGGLWRDEMEGEDEQRTQSEEVRGGSCERTPLLSACGWSQAAASKTMCCANIKVNLVFPRATALIKCLSLFALLLCIYVPLFESCDILSIMSQSSCLLETFTDN